MRLVPGWVVIACLLLGQTFAASQASIQGLLTVRDGSAVLRVGEKDVPVTSSRPSVLATLGDARISGTQLKVLGHFRADGRFDADEFFVVHPDGSQFRLIYFCDVCNITTFSPGECLCCQAPTVPTEVPVTDPRVYHDDVTAKPSKGAENR
jgi:hypothetical protein